jgi:SAM-dependent methyltransferase
MAQGIINDKFKWQLTSLLNNFRDHLIGIHPTTRIIHPQYLVNENLRLLVEKKIYCNFNLTETQHILDVGCGLKPYQYIIPKISWFGIDVANGPKVDLVVGGSIKWMISNDEFDAVLCTEVLEHAVDPGFVLAEIYRVMKPGAVALITTPFIYGVHGSPNDYRRYTHYGLIDECAEFEIIDSGQLGGIGSSTVININNWISTNLSKSFFASFFCMPIFFIHCFIFNLIGKGFDWFDKTGNFGTNSWVLLRKH